MNRGSLILAIVAMASGVAAAAGQPLAPGPAASADSGPREAPEPATTPKSAPTTDPALPPESAAPTPPGAAAPSPPAPALPTAPTSPKPCAQSPTILPQPSQECPETGRRAAAIRVARVAVELVLGVALGAAVGIIGAYAGLNADLLGGREAGAGLGIGTSLGVALGVAPGVWLGGRAMGGDGSFGWTLLGSALGTGAAGALLAIDDKPATLGFATTLPIAAAILGYELSSHTRRAKAPPKRPPTSALLPAFGPSYLGVVGIF